MKIGIFTDAHYSSRKISCGRRFNSLSLRKIEAAYSYFQKEQCELVICLGDLIDREDEHIKEINNLKSIAEIITKSNIPSMCLMGNHDGFLFTRDEFYEIMHECNPSNLVINGATLIFLDACYYTNGKHYAPEGERDWTNAFLPDHEKKVLEEMLRVAGGDVYIFMHQNIDSQVEKRHRIANAEEICQIIENEGNVKKVFQGHYHPGMKTNHRGIDYITLPAMCENESAYYVIEL